MEKMKSRVQSPKSGGWGWRKKSKKVENSPKFGKRDPIGTKYSGRVWSSLVELGRDWSRRGLRDGACAGNSREKFLVQFGAVQRRLVQGTKRPLFLTLLDRT